MKHTRKIQYKDVVILALEAPKEENNEIIKRRNKLNEVISYQGEHGSVPRKSKNKRENLKKKVIPNGGEYERRIADSKLGKTKMRDETIKKANALFPVKVTRSRSSKLRNSVESFTSWKGEKKRNNMKMKMDIMENSKIPCEHIEDDALLKDVFAEIIDSTLRKSKKRRDEMIMKANALLPVKKTNLWRSSELRHSIESFTSWKGKKKRNNLKRKLDVMENSEAAKRDEDLSGVDIGLTNKCANRTEGITVITLVKNTLRPEINITYQRKRRKAIDPSIGNLTKEAVGDTEHFKVQDITADNGETARAISIKNFCKECVDGERHTGSLDGVYSSCQLSCLEDGAKNANVFINHPMRSPITHSRRKLLVLDINGLLADIVPIEFVSDRYRVDTIISGKAVFKRPYCDDFLHFCFERFDVGVWSSRTKRNVDLIVNFLMSKTRHRLLFCWDQSHCTNTGFPVVGKKRDKPIIIKKLKKLWEKYEPDLPWERGEFDETNTLLLDDSPDKALCNPPNTAIFPFSYVYKNWRDNSLGPGGNLRVYLEGLSKAENTQKHVAENPFGQRPITERNASWPFYLRVIKAAIDMEKDDAKPQVIHS